MLADTVLGLHHFAFLRSWLQGLDLKWAWDRYMAFAEPASDRRYIAHRRKALLAQALRQGHQLDLSLPADRRITPVLNLLSREPVIAPAEVRPTLAEFAALEGLDPDVHTEAELLEIYQSRYPDDAGQGKAPSSEAHVRALNQLAGLLAVPPSPSDPLSRWLAENLSTALREHGVLKLGDLVGFINVHGYRWYRRVPKLGERRAGALLGWLQSIEIHLGQEVRTTALHPPGRQAAECVANLRSIQAPRQFGVHPLELLDVPPALSGADGLFRTGMPNTLGAFDDFTAIQNWLKKYEERLATWRSYKREVERFYLWCLTEVRKPLSSIDAMDCRAYRQFLAQVPARWINAHRVPPSDLTWRPYRAQPSASSQKLALVIVQTLFEGLRDAGYLVANPMAAVMKGFNLPEPRINADRSFTAREWDYVMSRAYAQAPSPTRTRLLLMLELFVALGLRIDELATAKRSALQEVWVDGEAIFMLTVTGKRRKQREVPVPDHVVQLLAQHRQALHDAPGARNASDEDAPLIVALSTGIPQWTASDRGAVLAPTPRAQTGSALTKSGIYMALKRFFKRIAPGAAEHGIDPRRIESASTHWMRHTFGRQAASDEVPLEVIQQALGHASLTTTTVYMSTERDRMVRELRKRRRPKAIADQD